MSIQKGLDALETHIAALKKNAGKTSPASWKEGLSILSKLANAIQSPDEAFFSAPVAPSAAPTATPSIAAPLAFDTVQANMALAEHILTKTEETTTQITKLASAGRKFNAARALADVHAVTSKVGGILNMDLTASWVESDLQKLASRADQLHGLFVPKV